MADQADYTKLNDFQQSVTVLLEFYKENTAHGRHLETQRQLISGFVLTIAGAVVGALASMKFDHGACIALGLVLIGFGVLGTAFSIVQYGKWTQSRERWRKIRDRLDTICVSAKIGDLRRDADKEMERDHSIRNRVGHWPLHWLWTLLNAFVLLLGFLFIVFPTEIKKYLPAEQTIVTPVELRQSNALEIKVDP